MNNYCDISKMSVREIPKSMAKPMVVKYHYSKLWTKCSVAFGLFHDTGEEHSFFDEKKEKMIGVIVYGDPIGRHSGASISELLDRTDVYELTRLFIFDGYGSNIESWFIGQTIKWLQKNTKLKALMSYAAPQEGHVGIVYQATNWIYQGNKIRPNDAWVFKFDENGKWQHGRTIFPYYGTNDPEKIRLQVKKPFWLKKELRKHRYVYLLGNRGQRKKIFNTLKYPSLPYPKEKISPTELEIIKMDPISGKG